MAKSTGMSKALAIGIGVITVCSVGCLVVMAVFFQIQVGNNKPTPPPRPILPTPLPTDLPESLRLPDSLIPESYNVFLQPYLYAAITNNYTEQSYLFTGNSTVRVNCTKTSSRVFLHVHNINVTAVEVRKSDTNEKLPLKGYQIFKNETNFLDIHLEVAIKENGTYDIFTEFEGELLEDLTGFYASRYTGKGTDDEDEERFLATSLLQPTDARTVFPCFDEPAMKAVFTITIIHRPEIRARSNEDGDPRTIQINGTDWIRTTFKPTKKMSSYLLGFIIYDTHTFSYVSKGTRTKIHVHGRSEAIDAGHADYALETTETILSHYENIFGLRYPMSKIDQIALPDFGVRAMENWGFISYQESGLLYDKETASTFDEEQVTTLIAHELAHQWFGNLVTMSWWNDLWLKEGFATYMSYKGVEAVGWDLKDLIVLREIQTAFQMDSLNTSHPLSMNAYDVQTSSQISELFDDITYSKGAAVLRMLATRMGENEFMKGVKMYLSKFQFENTVPKDLWECLNMDTHIKVDEFMKTWTEEVGYPVLTIITDTGDTSQEQFLLKKEGGHDSLWHIPIKYMTLKAGVKEFPNFFTDKGPDPIPDFKIGKDNWLLANINCTGFYRVNYDEENWNRLTAQLQKNHRIIPLINRGQLIDDAFNLARAHRLNVTIALNLTKYLINDLEYIPWESALKNLDFFTLMFDRSEVYGPIMKYLRNLVTPLYEEYEEYTINGTIPIEKYTDQCNQVNAITVACSNGLPECITMAKDLFSDYKNGSNPIHPNLRRAVYCSAVASGDEDDWEYVWEEYQKATVAAEKDKLRYALSCTKEIWLLNRYLQYTLEPSKIRKMDMVSTISYIAQNVAGQPLAWDFIRGHWSYITQEYGAGIISLGSLLDVVTKRFSTEVELEELKQLQREQIQDDKWIAARALEQVIERTAANIIWVKENKQVVKDWFIAEL
ncbi:alanyl (membrane) aminopeptidase-like b isoform X1 [Danio rerio]|uniref:Aminopeptidase n=5 Tax=Danio rerio TaxID=7955 RepID=Q1LWJ7_DANRE|nr:alanyl (membrane) aminopeptidase-like b [Danio rerio]|eukprot:NP_001038326.1 aminopeptidase N [Danio rerio]